MMLRIPDALETFEPNGGWIMQKGIAIAAVLLAIVGLSGLAPDAHAEEESEMKLTSPAFKTETSIPFKYTAYGDDISPKFEWSNLPEGTKQLAIVCDDPIASTPQPFVHWVIYNIPATAKGLPEALPAYPTLKAPEELKGTTQGNSGKHRIGYFGSQPRADGKDHRYQFTLIALDAELNLPPGLYKTQLDKAIKGHVLGKTVLVGIYQHKG
jgi:hypothetical protein